MAQSSSAALPEAESSSNASSKVNRFTIQVATINGSGSQTSNNILMRSLFGMGIPVGGKNLFPSNIQGLPTWFTIRASREGYLGQCREVDILVCMNPETAEKDVKGLAPGKLCVYDAPLKLKDVRDDLVFLEVPFAKLAGQIPDTLAKIRKLLANMCYVGVLAELLGIELDEIEKALQKQFAKKEKAVDVNMKAVAEGMAFVRESGGIACPWRVERMNATQGKIIIDGNSAGALGAMMAGCSVLAWYPITPSSSFCESFIQMARKHRHDPETGKATYAAVQAEDEIASIGMVLSAGFSGARAMTATSGPGISLMAEFAGMGYYAEIPAVILDVQRAGPSTGLPTRTQQADLLEVAFLSHGDTRHLAVIPGTVEECYEMTMQAFDLADRFQTPVFIMSDLDLAMNNWMADAFDYPQQPFDRGKVLTAEALEKMASEGKRYERYGDPDGDGIPYRTLPGNPHPSAAYLVRGSGHNAKAVYTEDPDQYVEVLQRIEKKFETARNALPRPVTIGPPDAQIGIIAFGSSHIPVLEALDRLRDGGLEAEYLRIRGYPFHSSLGEFVARHQRVYVVEQNRDAQMLQLLKGDLAAELAPRMQSILHYNGLPLDAITIEDEVRKAEGV